MPPYRLTPEAEVEKATEGIWVIGGVDRPTNVVS
jgi:hypothetical protein